MAEVAAAIREGAEAFLKRQYSTIAVLAIVVAILLFGAYMISGNLHQLPGIPPLHSCLGAFLSSLSGIIGMWISVRANLRSAAAATKNAGKSVVLALRGGAVSGLTIVSLSLLGVSLIFLPLAQTR